MLSLGENYQQFECEYSVLLYGGIQCSVSFCLYNGQTELQSNSDHDIVIIRKDHLNFEVMVCAIGAKVLIILT